MPESSVMLTRIASAVALIGLLVWACCSRSATRDAVRSFSIADDRFVKDGTPFQIISGRCAVVSPATSAV